MAALPTTGEISFGDIVGNRGVGESDVSIKTESLLFASGSRVADISAGNYGNIGDATDRTQLSGSPYNISEFRGADYPSSIITGITFTTDGSDSNTVDGEDLDVAFTTDGTGGTYTVRILDSSDNTDASTTRSGAGTVTFSNLALDDGNGYYAQVEYDQFNKVNDDATFNHHDAIGAVSITDPTDTTVASTTTVHAITHARSVANTNALNDYNWTFAKTAGDGGGLRLSGEGSYGSSVTSTASTPAIQYKGPGTFTVDLRVDGTPSQARNSTTATQQTHRIDYTKAITINNPSSVNQGTSYNITGNHKGYSSGIEVDEIKASDSSVLSSNDHGGDSTILSAQGDFSQAITPSTSAGNNTLSVKAKAHGGGVSAESSAYNIYPLLTTGKNTINASANTIYSSTNISTTAFANDSTTYNNSMTYNTPGTATDNVTGYLYSADSTPSGHSFGSATSATSTFGGGSGVDATVVVSLRIQGNNSQETTTTHNLAVLYKPCIIAITHTSGTLIVNETDVVVSAISWQGFSDATGLQLSIRNSGGGIVGSNTTVNYANTEGGTTTSVSKTGLSINLGDSSSAGTMYIRVAKINDTNAYRSFSITIADYTTISLYGVGAGYSTPEHALVAKLAGWSTSNKKLYPGTSWGNGVAIYDDTAGTRYNGGSYYHGYKPGSTTNYHTINSSGVIGNIYAGDDTVPPRDPSGAGNSASQTEITVDNYNVANYTYAASGTTSATFDSKITTKTVTVTWSDNSAIEDGYSIYQNNSSGTLKGTAAEDAETKDITGINTNMTFAVYARRDIGESTTVLSLNAATTSYTHTNDGTLYLQATNNSGGATTNLGTATGTGAGTQTITWDKDVLDAGTYTIRLRSGGYTGTQVAIDSSVVVTGILEYASWGGGPSNLATYGNQSPENTDTGGVHTVSVSNGTASTITLTGEKVSGWPSIGDGELSWRMASGGAPSGAYNDNSVTIGSGVTATIYVQFELEQNKSGATASGTAAFRLTNNGSSPTSGNISIGWDFNLE